MGPAQTTVSEIAKRAGVQRATVYNHFPTELELYDACSSHWVAEHPPPDPSRWASIEDAAGRVEAALAAMYAYYDDGQDMLENILRDEPVVPALEAINRRKWWPFIDDLVAQLLEGLEPSGRDRTRLEASIHVALNFFTWQQLSQSGLSNAEAAQLATSWVRASE